MTKKSTDFPLDNIKEAMHDMSVRKALEPLVWEHGMFLACREHIMDLGPKGKIDNKGSDGSTVYERINRHGKYKGICGENIQTGSDKAKNIVLSLLIDKKSDKKVHRRTLMEPKFSKGACCFGQNVKTGVWTVFAYTG